MQTAFVRESFLLWVFPAVMGRVLNILYYNTDLPENMLIFC